MNTRSTEGRTASAAERSLRIGLLVPAILLAIAVPEEAAARVLFNNGKTWSNPGNLIIAMVRGGVIVRNHRCEEAEGPCLNPGDPTGVFFGNGAHLVAGSHPNGLSVRDSSMVWIAGGQLGNDGDGAGIIWGYDRARIIMTGGLLEAGIFLRDAATFTLKDGFIESASSANDRTRMTIDGGTTNLVYVRELAVLRLGGGRARRVDATGAARVFVTGGTLGADPDIPRLRAFDEAVIEVIGEGFAVDGVPVPYGVIEADSGSLSGILSSGDAIDVRFWHRNAIFGNRTFDGTIALLPAPTPLPDADADGVSDRFDNCPELPNPGQDDRDVNGIGDACNQAEDNDGDEYANDRDTCPDVVNPEQTDTDGNFVGDDCNDDVDLDGDEFEDATDTCPEHVDAAQEDRDRDGRGDVCDRFPDDAFNLQAQVELEASLIETQVIRSELLATMAELDQCRADPPFSDADGDGEHDDTDLCPGTPIGSAIDGAGCSLPEFCALFDGLPRHRCNRADWRNDEARAFPQDCHDRPKSGACVPANPVRGD